MFTADASKEVDVFATRRNPRASGVAPLVPTASLDTLAQAARLNAQEEVAISVMKMECAPRVPLVMAPARASVMTLEVIGVATNAKIVPTTTLVQSAKSLALGLSMEMV